MKELTGLEKNIRRMNLAEEKELRRLGYKLDTNGEIIPSQETKKINPLKWLKVERIKSNAPRQISRRQFVFGLGSGLILASGGSSTVMKGHRQSASPEQVLPEDLPIEDQETVAEHTQTSEAGIESLTMTISRSEVEIGEAKVLLLADRIGLYNDVSIPDEGYEGFVGEPTFLVLHTDGGTDCLSTLTHLNRLKIHCQFVVGMLKGIPTSIQAAAVTKDRINISGTTGGSPVNTEETNLQFWGSLNVEMEGTPNNVNPEILDKSVELCLKILLNYQLKISQVIGHLEVPNNGKIDPGDEVLKTIRTRLYIELLKTQNYHLVDIYPDDVGLLSELFAFPEVGRGPATMSAHGRVMCWMANENSFVNWEEINTYLSENPHVLESLASYRSGDLLVNIEFESETLELSETYLGFPYDLGTWLTLPPKPLAGEEFLNYRLPALKRFVVNGLKILAGDDDFIGGANAHIT